MTTGSVIEPQDPTYSLVSTTSPVTTASGSDVLMSSLFANSTGVAHRVMACAAGTIGISRINDGGVFTSYPVLQGQYIDGKIAAVGSTSHGTSVAMTWIAEV